VFENPVTESSHYSPNFDKHFLLIQAECWDECVLLRLSVTEAKQGPHFVIVVLLIKECRSLYHDTQTTVKFRSTVWNVISVIRHFPFLRNAPS